MLDVAIVGAGLSGLGLAEKLYAKKPNLAVFEARTRVGGRILTTSIPEMGGAADLGPTWLWPLDQPKIAALVNRLGLTLHPQWHNGHSLYQVTMDATPVSYVDTQTHADAWRIDGGCQRLISGLLEQLPSGVLHLEHQLQKLIDRLTHVDLIFATRKGLMTYQARQVVLATPPRVLANAVCFQPELAQPLVNVMRNTPTWMAGHAKAVLVYPHAFWRQQGLSGSVYAPYPSAILGEVYDACPPVAGAGSLFGFFGLPADLRQEYRENLPALIIRQMVGIFGETAAKPLRVLIQDWSQEPFTATPADFTPVFEHPVYGHRALQLDHWQDKLYFCGTETASTAGGYMEGALVASDRVFAALTI